MLCELERSDLAALTATGWIVPERFSAKGRDGKTNIYGVIFRPTNFFPNKKHVVNALIKADKDFVLLLVPGGGHGIAESRYGSRRRRDFFVRHLLGVEPRHTQESSKSASGN